MSKLIVVIEDDGDVLEAIRYALKEDGYKVAGKITTERFEKITDIQPSMILLDNKLADGSGNELCLSIKSSPATKHIPVILVSTNSNIGLVAKKCKADGFLTKPFDLEDLIYLVKKHC
jgi:DNA-binding response OmpR family regulator